MKYFFKLFLTGKSCKKSPFRGSSCLRISAAVPAGVRPAKYFRCGSPGWRPGSAAHASAAAPDGPVVGQGRPLRRRRLHAGIAVQAQAALRGQPLQQGIHGRQTARRRGGAAFVRARQVAEIEDARQQGALPVRFGQGVQQLRQARMGMGGRDGCPSSRKGGGTGRRPPLPRHSSAPPCLPAPVVPGWPAGRPPGCPGPAAGCPPGPDGPGRGSRGRCRPYRPAAGGAARRRCRARPPGPGARRCAPRRPEAKAGAVAGPSRRGMGLPPRRRPQDLP